jgi:hypothetical protein
MAPFYLTCDRWIRTRGEGSQKSPGAIFGQPQAGPSRRSGEGEAQDAPSKSLPLRQSNKNGAFGPIFIFNK